MNTARLYFLYQIIRLSYYFINSIPWQYNIQIIGSEHIVFIIGRYAFSVSFGDTCLYIGGTAIAVIPIVVSVVAMAGCQTINSVQSDLGIVQCDDGLSCFYRAGGVKV